MKKYIIGLSILIFLMLTSFSINLNPIVIENYYNPSEELITVDEAPESFSPATTTPSATTTLMDNDKRQELAFQNFRCCCVEKQNVFLDVNERHQLYRHGTRYHIQLHRFCLLVHQ